MNAITQHLLKNLEDHCTWLNAIDAVDISSVMQSFWTEAESVTHYINRKEAAQKKSVRTPLPVTDTVMQEIAFRAIIASGEYPNDTRE